MKINTIILFLLILIFPDTKLNGQVRLPNVFGDESIDIIGPSLELEAARAYISQQVQGNADTLILRDAPLSYLFDSSGNINYFSMAIHIPGFLKWGDISLAAGISGNEINFVNPVSISGRRLIGEDL